MAAWLLKNIGETAIDGKSENEAVIRKWRR